MVLDLIFVIIIAVCVIIGIKQGFVRSLLGIASLFVSIIAAVYLYRPFIDLLYGIPAVSGVIDSIIAGIKNAMPGIMSMHTGSGTPAKNSGRMMTASRQVHPDVRSSGR